MVEWQDHTADLYESVTRSGLARCVYDQASSVWTEQDVRWRPGEFLLVQHLQHVRTVGLFTADQVDLTAVQIQERNETSKNCRSALFDAESL
jgi:hypothetical protein